MSVVRIWFAASGGLFLFLFLYAYAPIVLVFLVVTAGFGVLTAAIVMVARRFQKPDDGTADD